MVDWEGLKSDIETYFSTGKVSAELDQLGQSLAEQRRQQIASRNAVVTVVNNNVPNGTLGCGEWLVIVQTAPYVTLDVGTKLVKSEQHEKDQRVIAAAEKQIELLKTHPCLLEDGDFDHDWKFVDESFDHEFGTEVVHYYECKHCNATKDAGGEDDEG